MLSENEIHELNSLPRALVAPAIVIEPNAIADELLTGEISEHVIHIGNDGDD